MYICIHLIYVHVGIYLTCIHIIQHPHFHIVTSGRQWRHFNIHMYLQEEEIVDKKITTATVLWSQALIYLVRPCSVGLKPTPTNLGFELVVVMFIHNFPRGWI